MKWIYKLFKTGLFICNTFYFLIGIGLLITAAFIYINPSQINEFVKSEYQTQYLEFIYLLVFVSVFLILVGFIGCTGILNDKCWILFIYFIFLFIIFGFQFTGAIFIYLKSSNYFKDFGNRIKNAIKFKYGTSTVHTQVLDFLHSKFKCCGWISPKDWQDSTYFETNFLNTAKENVITHSPDFLFKIPNSCCVNSCHLTRVSIQNFHEVGCENIVTNHYNKFESYLAWIFVLLFLFQLILLVLALYLMFILLITNRKSSKSDSKEDENNLDENQDDERMYITSYYLWKM